MNESLNPDHSRKGFWYHVLVLGFILLLSAGPLLIDLGTRNPKHWMEGISLLTSQETWLKQHAGDSDAWLTPTCNENPRRNKPPLLVWMNMISWLDLEPETSTPAQLMYRARLVTVLLGLVLVGGTYWMGCQLHSPRLGLVAGLIAGSTPFFLQTQARMASYDMHLAAWTTLAAGAALWAWQFHSQPHAYKTAWLRWVICGVLMGLSWLSKNPLGVLVTTLLVASLALVDERHRMSRCMGFILALVVCLVVAMPWFFYQAQDSNSRVWDILRHEYSGQDSPQHGTTFYIILLRLALPWTLWLIGGLVHPFMFKHGETRSYRMIPWFWFVLILVVFTLHTGKAPRYILPIMPAIALLVAQVFDDHQTCADRGEYAPHADLLFAPHWILTLLASLCFMPFLMLQDVLVLGNCLDKPIVIAPTMLWTVILTPILFVIALIGAWRHLMNHPVQAALFMTFWIVLVSLVYWQRYAHSPNDMDDYRANAEKVSDTIGSAPLGAVFAPGERLVDLEFLFFLRRTVETVSPHGIENYLDRNTPPVYLMADRSKKYDTLLRGAGCQELFEFQDEAEHDRRLWIYDPE